MEQFDEVDMYSGLAAMHWSAYDDLSWDHDFYKQVVEQAGGLALDVACGAGRLLRSYLHAGLTVEGVDSSADMLAMGRTLPASISARPSARDEVTMSTPPATMSVRPATEPSLGTQVTASTGMPSDISQPSRFRCQMPP